MMAKMGENENSLYRLIYCSRAVVPIDYQTLRSIEEVSSRNNEQVGVTGFLLATNSRFFQVLEGDIESVNEVYNKVVKDSRHTDLLLLSYGPVSQRQFADWSMRGVYIGLINKYIVEQLKSKYGQENDDLKLPIKPELVDGFLIDLLSFLERG
jgi:hypothetical protein